jgi:hypothetical protein
MLYSAYGLRINSSFALTGARTDAGPLEDLPSLTLALQRPDEIDSAWRTAGGPPEWRGLLGDGRELLMERGVDGDLLFSYGELARFHLDPSMQRLDCAPSGAGLDWQRTLISKVIPTISVMRGYEALHASAVDAPEGVVAIMAPSGSGKSTLATELLARGWPLFADDVLALSQGEAEVQAHPGTPHMNIALAPAGGIDPLTLGDTLAVLGGERWLSVATVTARPRPVRMLCLLERRPDLALEIHTLSSNPLVLAPYMLGLSSDPERQRSRFSLYANLIESATLVRLTAGVEDPPRLLADLVEQALAQRPEPAVAR